MWNSFTSSDSFLDLLSVYQLRFGLIRADVPAASLSSQINYHSFAKAAAAEDAGQECRRARLQEEKKKKKKTTNQRSVMGLFVMKEQ